MTIDSDDLEFEFTLRPSDMEGFSDYLIEFRGKALRWSDEHADNLVVGVIDGYRLDVASALADGLDLDDFFDSINAEISEFKQAVCPGHHYVLRDGSSQGEELPCESLVYVSKLLVDADMRGHQIGTQLLEKLSNMVEMDNSMVGLKAFPLSDDPDNPEPMSRREIDRVRHFYERLGFRPASGQYMRKAGRDCRGPARRRAARSKI